jgi:phytoene dehydrogenase-like protein
VRYDAAIIGAGVNGLTAAAVLARAGLKTVVVERGLDAGGRLVTDHFHPGFAASAFAERAPEIPVSVSEVLALDTDLAVEPLPEEVRMRRDGALLRIFAEAREPVRHTRLARLRRALKPAPPGPPWPGQDLCAHSLAEWPRLRGWAMLSRATDPELAGSAMTLLALAGAEPLRGGLGALGQAFIHAASGAELRLGEEASEVQAARGRAGGLVLSDGQRIQADAVISTLDIKHSLLSLFPWAELPPLLRSQAAHFRMAGGTARLLLALRRPASAMAPLLLAGNAEARAAFRHGVVPDQPPLLIDPVSARDPSLAPAGGATLAVTLSAIPARLFYGDWTQTKRMHLAAMVLRRVDKALPGTLASLIGIRITLPVDIEARLGASAGDLDGGQLAPDQMLGFRPGARTPLAGFYLGGASTAAGPLGTGAAGFAAALSLLADHS